MIADTQDNSERKEQIYRCCTVVVECDPTVDILNITFSKYSGSTDIKKHMTSNLATVAVVPMTTDVPLSHFTRELCSAINALVLCFFARS